MTRLGLKVKQKIVSSITYKGNTNEVLGIGYEAFYGCSGLTSITIPNSVTSIGNYAFSGCTGLTEFHSKATTPPYINSDYYNFPFSSSFKTNTTLYVPQGCSDAYESWKNYFKEILEE